MNFGYLLSFITQKAFCINIKHFVLNSLFKSSLDTESDICLDRLSLKTTKRTSNAGKSQEFIKI